jgi:hypothetical protein
MVDVDVDTYVREAIQAKVQKDIEDKVYDKIKSELRAWKFLGINGSILGGTLVALVLAFHGQIFSFIVESGGDSFRQSIQKSIEDDKNALIQTQADIKARIGTAREDLMSLSATAAKDRDAVIDTSNQIQEKLKNLNDAGARLDQLVKQQQAAEESIKVNEARIATALSRLSDATAAVEQLSRLYDQITADLKANKSLPDTISDSTQVANLYASPKARSTVYFQFAGFDREEVIKMSEAISQKGWQIPGQERTTAAANTNQIRFNPKDGETAKLLKDDTDQALKELGYDITMTLQSNPHVKAGIPEIWVYKR